MKSPEYQTQAANALAVLIKDIAREIVLHPDDLFVEGNLVAAGMVGVLIEARPSDVKRLIGTKGAHIRALRVFCKYFGEAAGLGITVADFEVQKDNSDRYPEFVPSDDWGKDRDRLLEIFGRMARGVFLQPFEIEDVVADGRIFVAIRVSPAEHERVIFGMTESFKVLGLAIGKKSGHTISVHVLPKRSGGTVRRKEIAEPAGRR